MLRHRLIAEFDYEAGVTDRVLERAVALPLDWRPHARSRSTGELASHLADVPAWALHILDRVECDLDMLPPPHEAPFEGRELLQRFRTQAAAARRLLDKTDAELSAVWRLTRGGENVYSMPRTTAFRRLVLNHLIHHRGQLSVYVRMNGGVVPTIYGASADDAWDYAPST